MQAYKRPKKTIPRVDGSRHEQNWLDTIKGKTKATSPFDYAGPFTETVLLGNLAIAFPGTKLMWDGAGMKVTNNARRQRPRSAHVPRGVETVGRVFRPA